MNVAHLEFEIDVVHLLPGAPSVNGLSEPAASSYDPAVVRVQEEDCPETILRQLRLDLGPGKRTVGCSVKTFSLGADLCTFRVEKEDRVNVLSERIGDLVPG